MGTSLPRTARRWFAAAVIVTSLVATAGPVLADAAPPEMSGTLLDSSGTPVTGALVKVQSTDGTQGYDASTDDSGNWEVDGIVPEKYQVEFLANGSDTYAYGKYTSDTADVIPVVDTSVVVNDTIPAPLLVSGTITDAKTKAPLAGICASYIATTDPSSRFGESCTGADGKYSLSLSEPGRFEIVALDASGKYAGAATKAFTVAAGQQITGKNLALSVAGTVSGKVVDRATGKALANICPSASVGQKGGPVLGSVTHCSSATGQWSLGGLPPTGVTVVLDGDKTHVPLWVAAASSQSTAKVLKVTSGKTTSAGTVKLYHGAELSGRITTTAGKPVKGSWVQLGIYSSRCGAPCTQYSAKTNTDGKYTIKNIEPTKSIVSAEDVDQHFATAFSGGVTDPAKAKKINFKFDGSDHFNAVLTPEAKLKLTLKGFPGSTFVDIDAYSLNGLEVGTGGEVTAPGGTVTLAGLFTGPVRLKATYGGEDSTTVWYKNATTEAKGTSITLTAKKTKSVTWTFVKP